MKKVVGYAFAILGFVLIAVGMNLINYDVSFLGDSPKYYLTIAGVVSVIVSVFVLKNSTGSVSEKSGVVTSVNAELPIFEGDNIVGYRRSGDTSKSKKRKK
jgi:hypothetical protein